MGQNPAKRNGRFPTHLHKKTHIQGHPPLKTTYGHSHPPPSTPTSTPPYTEKPHSQTCPELAEGFSILKPVAFSFYDFRHYQTSNLTW